MPGLLIVGAGGHGKVVADAANETGYWQRIAFLEDEYPKLKSRIMWPVLGKIESAPAFMVEYSDIAVAIGDNRVRLNLIHSFIKMGFNLPIIVHPTSFISRFATIGAGSVLFAQTVVNAGTQIGTGAIVNTGATIDHDCLVGDGVHISPGAHLAGEVKVGNYSWLGIGSSIIQQISIGKNVVIGAGTVVIKDVPDDVTVVGIPGIVKKNSGMLSREYHDSHI